MNPKGRFLSKISTLNVIERANIHDLFDTISSMTQLTSLNISYNTINIEGIKLISDKLKQLICLDVTRCKINIEGVQYISSNLKQLTSLKIGNNEIDVEGIKYICSELKQLTNLEVNDCELDIKAVKYISEMKQLRKLNICENYEITKLPCEGVKYISEMKELTELNISENYMKSEDVQYISELKQLTCLNVTDCEINSEGVKHITDNLKQLTDLRIGDNEIGVEGFKYICNGELKCLTKLVANNTNIHHRGLIYIGNLKQLTSLNISRNNIDQGVKYMSELHNLQELYINYCYISSGHVAYIGNNLKQLTFLDIGKNVIGAKGLKYIQQLTKLKTLKANNIYRCFFRGDAIEGMKSISELKQLTFLDISKLTIEKKSLVLRQLNILLN